MGKRTPQSGLPSWEDAQELDAIVIDKRPTKRAGRAKGRRRDRRYENRLLRTSLDNVDLAKDALTAGWEAADREDDPTASERRIQD
ncbi:MAG: hypothetical protein AAF892_10460 [Cyanobacteria bacterium P01_D01_bin.71]